MQNYTLQTIISGTTFPGCGFSIEPQTSIYLLENALIEMKVRISPYSEAVLDLTSLNGGIAITGDYTFEIPAQIIDIKASLYEYDIKITFSDGRKKIYIRGQWLISPAITY